ncbi:MULTISPECIES: hypothetical protein [Methanobacterium]|uniref:Uncharacterized protein n=1 Tax=Methanobacterium bryantii TaxID=2161 RepID=A0A2A2H8U6_METBR|nr:MULTISPECIES: hypothetical protein [Methanobacterium]OEC85684.1 hypothetical protein A9507_13080 [Methanobacterium sp. A39]PAV05881.1 hypothetical protein ASJ80_13540 [Methanobacterium bryantii]
MNINDKMEATEETLKTLGLIDGKPVISVRPDLISEECKRTVSKKWEESCQRVDQLWDEHFSDIKSISETID